MMKLWITRILFRLISPNVSYQDIDDKKITGWLALQGADMGFHEFFRKRDLQLLKTIGAGQERENYLILVGQRLELLHLLQRVQEEGEKLEKQRQQRQREAEEKANAERSTNKSGV